MVFQTFLAAIAIMLVSLIGVIATWGTIGSWLTKKLHYLVSFAAGVFVVVAYGLAVETFELAPDPKAILYIVLGTLFFSLIGKVLPEAHHHHDPQEASHIHSRKSGQRILLADALHNMADGIVLAAGFGISFQFGIVVAIGVLIHEAIQEISEFFVLRNAGYTTKEALIRNFLASSTILIGVVIALLFSTIEGIEPILLGLGAGSFFYVVFVDLVPGSLSACKTRFCIWKHIATGMLGFVLMISVNVVTDQTHIHGGDSHDTHEHEEEHYDHDEELG
jgi:zinc and cadmium transporter